MLETCADHEHALPNADLRAEVERLRTEVRALRRENLELRAVLAANREMADPTAGGCSMELTAGTSIGHAGRSNGDAVLDAGAHRSSRRRDR